MNVGNDSLSLVFVSLEQHNTLKTHFVVCLRVSVRQVKIVLRPTKATQVTLTTGISVIEGSITTRFQKDRALGSDSTLTVEKGTDEHFFVLMDSQTLTLLK